MTPVPTPDDVRIALIETLRADAADDDPDWHAVIAAVDVHPDTPSPRNWAPRNRPIALAQLHRLDAAVMRVARIMPRARQR